MQNRKSAKKCRLKKKAEFGQMRGDVMKLQEENKNLKEKVSWNLLYLLTIQIDQWNHYHVIPEDGRKFHLTEKVWAVLDPTSYVPLADYAELAGYG